MRATVRGAARPGFDGRRSCLGNGRRRKTSGDETGWPWQSTPVPAGVVVTVMGVAGSGKTTVGAALAAALGWRFVDADDHHSPGASRRWPAASR